MQQEPSLKETSKKLKRTLGSDASRTANHSSHSEQLLLISHLQNTGLNMRTNSCVKYRGKKGPRMDDSALKRFFRIPLG